MIKIIATLIFKQDISVKTMAVGDQFKNPRVNEKEELANWLTHGLGLLLSIAGFLILIIVPDITNNATKAVSVFVYGPALIFMYASSTLYHAVSSQKLKRKFQIADHSAIYVKIAGTYTPFTLLALKENYGLVLLSSIWGLAGAGVIFKLFFTDKYNLTSTVIYLAMGWLAIVAVKPLFLELTRLEFIFLLAGGLSYTVGVIFFLWEKLAYSHPIWHLFVIAGSAFHYFAILFMII